MRLIATLIILFQEKISFIFSGNKLNVLISLRDFTNLFHIETPVFLVVGLYFEFLKLEDDRVLYVLTSVP